MAGPEKLVKDHVKKRLLSLAPDCWFFMPSMGAFGFAGVPDFIGVCRGLFFAVETKALGKHPTKLQEICMALIEKAGGTVIVIRGAYDPKELGWAKFDKYFKN